MQLTPYRLKRELPAFEQLDEQQIAICLDRAKRRIDPRQWGAKAYDATVLLTGHFLACDMQPHGFGAVASRTVDDVSESYHKPSGSEIYGSTVYGRQYLALLRTLMVDRAAPYGSWRG